MSEHFLHPAHLHGTVDAPPSKSQAHRKLICAGLTAGVTELDGWMSSRDTDATLHCLETLGVRAELADRRLTVHGLTDVPAGEPLLDCGDSGSTVRFLVPLAMALTHGGVFRLAGRMNRRPMEVYRDLFVPRNVRWFMTTGADGEAELHVSGPLQAGDYVLPGNISSQFISGLLMALPLLTGVSTITVRPPVESGGYIRMTLQALRESGIRIEDIGTWAWRIPGKQQFHAQSGALHGDYSHAAAFLSAAALGQDVIVRGLNPQTEQGDRAMLAHLQTLGAEIEERDGLLRVIPHPLHGASFDLPDCPDLAPMLALTCALAEGESRLSGCGRLRLKECDRLSATASILNSLGAHATVRQDTLLIQGVKSLRGGVTVDARQDHRMVMMTAMAATVCERPVGLTEEDIASVSKSWPDFFRVYASVGGMLA